MQQVTPCLTQLQFNFTGRDENKENGGDHSKSRGSFRGVNVYKPDCKAFQPALILESRIGEINKT
jgi:hypothetical protein